MIATLPVRTLRVLCAEPQNYSQVGLRTIAAFTKLETADLSQEEFTAQAGNYHVLMVRLQRRITGEMIASSPNLRAILSPTTGLDHIDLQSAKSHDVIVFSLHGENDFLREIHSSAEHTFALLLSLIRNIPQAIEAVKNNEWQQISFRGHELNGKTLGIIGYGRIGTKIASYGNAFGMRIHAYDPYVKQYPSHVQPKDSLASLLKSCDILCVCVPLCPQTIGMIGLQELKLLRKGSFLVNTSRGDVLDEEALLQSLEGGYLAGAAVDVLTNEYLIPTAGHPLIEYAKRHSNLQITPHIAGTAVEAIEKTDLFVIDKFKNWIKK